MTVINTNTASLSAQYNLGKVNKAMGEAMEQLSSGKRINSASDDAAGLAISTRQDAQIKGLDQAIRNAADGQSLIDTTEGAHEEITNILQRMRELAVQASNDTNASSDRTSLQAEITQLTNEIDRIASQTTWNGSSLMDGSFSAKQLQIGADQGQSISFSVANASVSNLGSHLKEGLAISNATNAVAGSAINLSGHLGAVNITTSAAASAKAAAALVNAQTDNTGIEATAVTKASLNTISAAGTVSFTLKGDNGTAASISASVSNVSHLGTLRDAINTQSGVTGITAAFGTATAELILTHASGETIDISGYTNSGHATATMKLDALDKNAASISDSSTLTEGGVITANVTGQLTTSSAKAFTITETNATATQGHFASTGGASAASSVSTINIGSVTGAQAAISVIDGALDQISIARSDLGAISNRLDHTMSNLGNISMNTQAAKSGIEDADFAKLTGELTKSQIMSQAATAMLAQANASKQGVLSLLQG